MFISFEGCEGSGKTTLSRSLFKKINLKNDVILTKEPDANIPFNIEIKKILLSFDDKISSLTEALLYAANRAEHLDKIISPALKNNKIVICDRYLDSSIAYQGYARKLGSNLVNKINFFAFQHLPDITFYLDLEPDVGIQRLKKNRKEKMEYFDLKNIHFHNLVRKGFLELCEQFPERIYKLDANLSLEELEYIIITKIKKSFKIKI
ncbi:thymidylate kinase [Candidatus Phytoplasma luffae]|uniref:Thymidylate kinase n=1 Tax=Loofah witches'-broom phytoplasma TaxID=35773 RepID=A0A975IM72_LOWBP|nr:dTMP kinase [Candidatus Phytoplasma luffae]QTX02809.1 thymidylate kinase [Candidatus Phytoplasma luffae]